MPMSALEDGFIPDGKDSGMTTIPPLNYANRNPQSNLRETSFSGSTSVAASIRQSLDIAVTTTEGDQVTLSSTASATAAAYAIYEGAVTARASAGIRSNEVSLSAEGDLNRQETKDIAKAIHAYAKVTRDMMSGRTQPAEAHAREFSRLDEISSFDATFTSQQSFTAQTQSTVIEAE